MVSIKTRLLSAEDELLSALDQGKDAVAAFSLRWESLLEEIDRAMDTSELDVETSGLAHTVALRCATLAEISADLVAECDNIHSHLMGELDSLMSELTIYDSLPSSVDVTINHSTPIPVARSLSCGTKSSSTETGRKRRRSEEGPTLFSSRGQRVTAPKSMRLPAVDDNLSKQNPSPRCFPSSNQSTPHPSHLIGPPIRKRRHSDADLGTPPLRHKRLCAGPRLHAVSDSFSISRGTGSCSFPMSPSLFSSIPLQRELVVQTPDASTPLDLQPLFEPSERFYGATLPDSVLFDLSAPFISQAEAPNSTLDAFLESLFKDSEPFQSSPAGILQSPLASSTPGLSYSPASTECGSDSRSSSPFPSTPSYPSTPPAVNLSEVESSVYDTWSDYDPLHGPVVPLLPPDSQLLIHDIITCTPSDETADENLKKDWSLPLGPLDPLLLLAISPSLTDSQSLIGCTPPLAHMSMDNIPAAQLTSFFESSEVTPVDAC